MEHARRLKIGDRVRRITRWGSHPYDGRVVSVDTGSPFVTVEWRWGRSVLTERINAMWLEHEGATPPEPQRETYWDARRNERIRKRRKGRTE